MIEATTAITGTQLQLSNCGTDMIKTSTEAYTCTLNFQQQNAKT